MSIVLGFGETEKRYESELEDKIRAYIDEHYYEQPESYFTESFKSDIKTWVDALSKESRELSDVYKTSEDHPERYSYFFPTTIGDSSHLVFIISVHHINRRHPLSPDGWGMMKSELLFYVDEWEAGRSKRERDAA